MVCFHQYITLFDSSYSDYGLHVELEFYFAGKKTYSLTWALQYVNLFMINVGYIILAGQALKVSSLVNSKLL